MLQSETKHLEYNYIKPRMRKHIKQRKKCALWDPKVYAKIIKFINWYPRHWRLKPFLLKKTASESGIILDTPSCICQKSSCHKSKTFHSNFKWLARKECKVIPLQKLQRRDKNKKQQLAWVLVRPAYILETGSIVFSHATLGQTQRIILSLLALKTNKNNTF